MSKCFLGERGRSPDHLFTQMQLMKVTQALFTAYPKEITEKTPHRLGL